MFNAAGKVWIVNDGDTIPKGTTAQGSLTRALFSDCKKATTDISPSSQYRMLAFCANYIEIIPLYPLSNCSRQPHSSNETWPEVQQNKEPSAHFPAAPMGHKQNAYAVTG